MAQQLVLPRQCCPGPDRQVRPGQQCFHPLRHPLRQVGAQVAQPEVVARRAVLDAQQPHQRLDREAQVQCRRLGEVTAGRRPGDQPPGGLAPCRDLLHRLAALGIHLRLVVVLEVQQAVRVVQDDRRAVAPGVHGQPLGRGLDDQVDQARRPRQVARIRLEVEEALPPRGPGRLRQLPDVVDVELSSCGRQHRGVRRRGVAAAPRLHVEVGVLVPPAGDRGAVDHDHLQRGHAPGERGQQPEDVVVPAEVCADPHVSPRIVCGEEGYAWGHAPDLLLPQPR